MKINNKRTNKTVLTFKDLRDNAVFTLLNCYGSLLIKSNDVDIVTGGEYNSFNLGTNETDDISGGVAVVPVEIEINILK